MDNFYTVIVTLITVLSGTTIWRYFERRAMYRDRDADFIRNDCRERILKLEVLLHEASKEKNELRKSILEMTAKIAELQAQVNILTQEREILIRQIENKDNDERQILKG